MSEHEDESKDTANTMLNSEFDGTNDDQGEDSLARNFIRYSDSVDERMMGIADRRKDAREINFNSWERRGNFQELSSDSEEETTHEGTSQIYMVPKKNIGINKNEKQSESVTENNFFERQYEQQNEEMLVNERIDPKKQELVKKFNTIELLREKVNVKQTHENETPKPTCSAQKACQEDEESELTTNLEEFFGRKRLGKKRRNMWKGKETTSCDSDESFANEESDKEIDELVELLSSASLIKIYDENLALPKEEDEILKTFLQPEEKESALENSTKMNRKKTIESLIDVFENLPETEYRETSKIESLDDGSDWKTDTSEELCTTFDGYDVDNPSSFHDWMLDDILAKSLSTSSELELTVCPKCISCHNSTQECFQE